MPKIIEFLNVQKDQRSNVPPPLPLLGIASRCTGWSMEDYWLWCPSVVQAEDGRYCMYASRWPKRVPFHPCWLTHSEVVLAVSEQLEGPYKFQEVALPPRGAQYWDGLVTHNPKIIRYGGGYALFYTGISHPLADMHPETIPAIDDPRVICARAGKRIGMATSHSAYGPWNRMDAPILPTKPGTFHSFLTSNASPCLNEDGSVTLLFKSRRHVGNVHGPMVLGLAQAEHIHAPYRVLGEISFDTENPYEVEDPFLWRNGSGFEMIAKDMTGSLCGEPGAGIHAFSENGLHWTLHSNPKAYSRSLLWDDGQLIEMGSVERASLLFKEGRPTHLVAALADGPGGFAHASNTWNGVIPLQFE
jgi:hypothetical protein